MIGSSFYGAIQDRGVELRNNLGTAVSLPDKKTSSVTSLVPREKDASPFDSPSTPHCLYQPGRRLELPPSCQRKGSCSNKWRKKYQGCIYVQWEGNKQHLELMQAAHWQQQGLASSQAERVTPVGTHIHVYTTHVYVQTQTDSWIGMDWSTPHSHKQREHQWPHPAPLSGWWGWKHIRGKLIYVGIPPILRDTQTQRHTHALWIPSITGVRYPVYPAPGPCVPWLSSHLMPRQTHTCKLVFLVASPDLVLSCSQLSKGTVSPVTNSDPLASPVHNTQTLWSLQYPTQTHGCSYTWLPSLHLAHWLVCHNVC